MSESTELEFKRELPLSREKEKREVARDIAAMANTHGGWIVYGIDERGSASDVKMTASVTPLPAHALGSDQTIDNIAASAIFPPPVIRIHAIPWEPGFCLVVHVIADGELHMVTGYNDNRYYRRSALGVRPMTEVEVRERYALVASRRQNLRADLDAFVEADKVGLSGGFWSGIVPFAGEKRIDPGRVPEELLQGLSNYYLDARKPTATGLEMAIGAQNERRLRIHRSGAVSAYYGFAGVDKFRDEVDERSHTYYWSPLMAIEFVLTASCLAHRIGSHYGIISPGFLSLWWKTGAKRRTQEPSDRIEPLYLQGSGRHDIPFERLVLATDRVRLAREAMDYVWQTMGATSCSYFSKDGSLVREFAERFVHWL